MLAALVLTACSRSVGPVDGAAAYAHVEKILAFGPRPAGSEALAQAAGYLKAEIAKLGLEPLEQVWEETVDRYGKPAKLVLRNVWTRIPARSEGAPVLLLAAHYDSKSCQDHPDPAHDFRFVGAIDGTGGPAVLLELARVLKTRPSVPEVWLLWIDGEESVEWEWDQALKKCLLGSQHFVKTMAADKSLFPKGLAERMRAMVLLDLIGDKDIKIDRDTHSSGTLLEIFGRAAEKMGEKERMYRWDSPMVDDHVPFRNLGVAVIDLIDFRWRSPAEWQQQGAKPEPPLAAWWHTDQDTLDKMSPQALAFAGNLVWHALDEIEQKLYGR